MNFISDQFEGINASQIVEFDMQFDVDPRYDSISNQPHTVDK